jgi:hypothetical protein
MITSSACPGTAPPTQFAAVAQSEDSEPSQTTTAAKVFNGTRNNSIKPNTPEKISFCVFKYKGWLNVFIVEKSQTQI